MHYRWELNKACKNLNIGILKCSEDSKNQHRDKIKNVVVFQALFPWKYEFILVQMHFRNFYVKAEDFPKHFNPSMHSWE